MQILSGRWGFPVFTVGLTVLLVFYVAAYFRALRPRTGTLEWIAFYDQPAFSLAGRWHPLTGGDAWAALVSLLLGAGIWATAGWTGFGAALRSGMLPTDFLVAMAVTYVVLPGLTALGAYLLFRGLFGSRAAALLAVAAVMLDLTAEPETMVFAVWSGLFLCRFLTAGEDHSFGEACPNLILAFALLAVGPYFSPALLWLAAADLVILAACSAGRFVHLGRGWFWAGLATALATLVLTTLALYLPAALLAGMRFPQLLLSRDYYLLIWQRLTAIGWEAFRPGLALEALVVFLYDWSMVLCGLCGLAAALGALFGRWDPLGLVLTLWCLAVGVMAVLGNTFCLPMAFGGCFAMVWSDLLRRDRKGLAWMGGTCVIVMMLTLYLYRVLP